MCNTISQNYFLTTSRSSTATKVEIERRSETVHPDALLPHEHNKSLIIIQLEIDIPETLTTVLFLCTRCVCFVVNDLLLQIRDVANSLCKMTHYSFVYTDERPESKYFTAKTENHTVLN